MFPNPTLLLGTSLLWSVTPLHANPVSGCQEDVVVEAPELETAPQVATRAKWLLHDVRLETEKARRTEALRVLEGLTRMFDRGDRRVIPCGEITNPGLWADTPAVRLRRAKEIAQLHIDLYDEALAA